MTELTSHSSVPLAFMPGSWVIQINTSAGDPIPEVLDVFRVYKIARTE